MPEGKKCCGVCDWYDLTKINTDKWGKTSSYCMHPIPYCIPISGLYNKWVSTDMGGCPCFRAVAADGGDKA